MQPPCLLSYGAAFEHGCCPPRMDGQDELKETSVMCDDAKEFAPMKFANKKSTSRATTTWMRRVWRFVGTAKVIRRRDVVDSGYFCRAMSAFAAQKRIDLYVAQKIVEQGVAEDAKGPRKGPGGTAPSSGPKVAPDPAVCWPIRHACSDGPGGKQRGGISWLGWQGYGGRGCCVGAGGHEADMDVEPGQDASAPDVSKKQRANEVRVG